MPIKILHVPKADEINGMLVVPGVPKIDIWVLPSREACNGMTNSPTDLVRDGPAGGSVTALTTVRS